ncbi:prolyl oligopeptidase family serine peptidase [Mucilaginibacter jinjuensis]|uniref:Prolyl oligopeptidase family serine peptidase n=1 Tax=Mucilaginibacter jinjuensis TaxID=1176721 RepID=A0ABY7TA51_9SPHI|nr:prolyl oligopeptidase family serine peptidase [Mucilaginibacter jinjuensis]WCT13380.1 prolyl oligopeptidase family serine peptidase [Mucilaginibacter jinjuensis]
MTNKVYNHLALVILIFPLLAGNHFRSKIKSKIKGDTISQVNPLHPDYQKYPLREWESEFSDFAFFTFQKQHHMLPYRLHKPALTQPGKKYPLVLFFHGAGERGNDNRKQLLRFTTLPFWQKHECYILAPQCPAKPENGPDGESVWVQTNFGATSHRMREVPSWPLHLAMELLNKVISENSNIDPRRIYVTGLSMGGYATWEILQRENNKFAAAMPVCGGADIRFAKKLSRIPIWVFHGDSDKIVPVSRSRDMVKAITEHGGKPVYTEFPGVRHDAWTVTYNDQKVWDWLFDQRK